MDESSAAPLTKVGFSRRDMLKKAAATGALLAWTVPAVEALSAGVAAAGSPAPGPLVSKGYDLSFVSLLLSTGGASPTYYAIKFDMNSSLTSASTEFGNTYQNGNCTPFSVPSSQISPLSPPGVTYTIGAGFLSVTVPSPLTVVEWVAHGGQICDSTSSPGGYAVTNTGVVWQFPLSVP